MLCAFVVGSQAGFLAAPVHYSPAEAVSSQNIVRHEQPAIAKLAVAAPFAYHAAPAPIAYQAPIAKILSREDQEIVS